MSYIKGIDGRSHILYAIHLGEGICGAVAIHGNQGKPGATLWVEFEKCGFSMAIDTLRPKLGRIDMLPLVVRFHREHHADLGHDHGPWTVWMELEDCKGPDVKVSCILLRITNS